MAVERTLSIIKPDATRRNLTGKIIAKFEDAGLRVVASRRIKLSQADAEAFYGVHREHVAAERDAELVRLEHCAPGHEYPVPILYIHATRKERFLRLG